MRIKLALLCIALLGAVAPASAQTVPFGKNKIQYRSFDWQVLSGDHVDVYYYPEEEAIARLTLAYAEESYDVLERRFRHHPFRRVPLIVYSSDQHFEQTNVFPGFIPEGVLGFTEYLKRRVALPFRGDYDQFRKTLRHELIHFFQLSKLTEVQRQHPRIHGPTPQRIHWWTEGLAEFWSGEQTAEDYMFIRDVVLNGGLPTIEQFNAMYSFAAYPLGGELHKYLAGRFGEEYIVEVYENYWKYDDFGKTLQAALDVPLDRLSREWHYDLQQRFFPTYADRPPLDVGALPVIHRGGGNMKPTLYQAPGDSLPTLFFLSPRTGYTNIYRTPLHEGEASVKTVVEGERSAEFESFHAYESGLDVSQNGVLVFVSRYLERDALVMWDLKKKGVVGRYQWPDLVGLKSPAWDPTGRRIVFEGLSTAGFSDLYTIDFTTQERVALTDDSFRDEDPDWSVDGKSIVFASDRTRFGSDGYTNLFSIDVDSHEVRYLTYGAWHDQDPRWSNDGTRIVFSSDRTGLYDLYQIDAEGNGKQLTALSGGAFDPEWLPGDSGVVFAGYGKGAFRIYRLDIEPAADTLPRVALELPDGELAPAGERLAASVVGGRPAGWEWHDPEHPELEAAEERRYDTWDRFAIDFAGGDALVAPGYGSAQGIQFLASDMLGNHIVFLGVSAAQASDFSSFVDNFSGNAMYLNLTHRLNYGAGLFRYKGRFRDVTFDIYDEESYGGYFVASYPFSKFRRVELQLGVERSLRDDIADAFEASPIFGGSAAADSLNLTREGILTSNYLSFVQDNTLWVPTGPIDGTRYNLTAGLVTCFACEMPSDLTGEEVARGATAENFVISADYRRYIRTSLLSAYAIRAWGYYSDGAIPGRAVLGGPTKLRGYPRFSLAGSRVVLVNQEWRFPVLHAIGIAFPFGTVRFPGVQGAFFGDAGSAWLERRSPTGTWGSYGVGLRTSLGAPLVLRLDVGRRYSIGDRPPVVLRRGEDFDDTFIDFFFGYNF